MSRISSEIIERLLLDVHVIIPAYSATELVLKDAMGRFYVVYLYPKDLERLLSQGCASKDSNLTSAERAIENAIGHLTGGSFAEALIELKNYVSEAQ